MNNQFDTESFEALRKLLLDVNSRNIPCDSAGVLLVKFFGFTDKEAVEIITPFEREFD